MTTLTPDMARGYLNAIEVSNRARSTNRTGTEVRRAMREADKLGASGDQAGADYLRGAAIRWCERGCEIANAPHTNNHATALSALATA